MLAYIINGITYGLAAGVQPGPLQTFAISQTLKYGWRKSIKIAFAPLISDGPIVTLMVLLLSQVPPWLETTLHIAGGLFVLYLALGAYRTWRSYAWEPTGDEQGTLLKAVVTNFLNPGPYLFWGLVTGPLLVQGWRESPANALGLLLGFYITMISTSAVLIVLFGAARNLGPRVSRAMIGLSAVALAAFGLYQLGQGLVALWA